MANPMYRDYPEICSIHKCEMDGERCPECDADDFVAGVLDELAEEISVHDGRAE